MRTQWRIVRCFAVALLVLVLAAACTDDDDSSGAGTGPEATATATASSAAPTTAGQSAQPIATGAATAATTPESNDDDDDQATSTAASDDTVILVSDAGEIEIRRDGNALALVEVRPAEGWTQREDDDDDDEIEVELARDGQRIEMEAEIEDDRVETSVCDKDLTPSGEVFTIDGVGEVEVRRGAGDDDNLELVEVRPDAGWSHRVDDDDDDEVEIRFDRDGEVVKFKAEVDDDRIEAKSCTVEVR